MELRDPGPGSLAATSHVLYAGPWFATRRVPTYRCQECGSEIARDSLAAFCQCVEECYADGWSVSSAGGEPIARGPGAG